MNKKHFLQGALILSIAAILSKVLSIFYRIPLQQFTGDEGYGMYQAVYPVFTTVLILIVSGVPIVLSKLISEQVALGNVFIERKILKFTTFFILCIGVISFLAMFFGASLISTWLNWPESALSIRAVSFALLIMPLVAVLRGFFYGHQYMSPAANSQIIEQLFRVITILIMVLFLLQEGFSLSVIIAGATFGTVSGALFSLIYLVIHYVRFQKKRKNWNVPITSSDSIQGGFGKVDLVKRIIFFTVAVSISSLMVPLLNIADSFTATQLLEKLLGDQASAQKWFGIYSRGIPLVQITTIFATSLALSLIPKISEAEKVQNLRDVSHSSYLALKITIMLGLPASIGLAMLANEVNLLFFGNEQGSLAFSLLSIASFFLTLAITTSAVLQGLGRIYLPAIYLIIALIVKVSLNLVLIPRFSIDGAAIATLCSYGVLLWLNARTVAKSISAFAGWTQYLKIPFMASAIMGLAVMIGDRMVRSFVLPHPSRMETAVLVTLLIGIGVLVYGIMILLFKGISRNEIIRIPKLGAAIVNLLSRLRLIQ